MTAWFRNATRGVSVAALAAASIALMPGCQTTPEEQTDGMAKQMNVPSGNFAVQWRADVPVAEGGIKLLAVADDRVLAYTEDNLAYFINRDGGSVLAQVRAARPRAQLFEPFVTGDNVVFPSSRELAIFTRNGKLKQRLLMSRFTASSGATGDDKMLVFGVDNPAGGRAIAVENKPQLYGSLPTAWEVMTRGQVTATPAVWQEGIFVGSRDGAVYAVRLGDRDGLWAAQDHGRFVTGGEILADLKADKDGVYVSSMDGKLYALDSLTGRVKWTYYAGQSLREPSSPVATADTVYIYVPRQGVAAIDKAATQEIRPHKWIVPGTTQFLAADAQNVYLRADDNSILAVDRATGAPKFRSQRKDFVAFASNDNEKNAGVIYAATAAGNIFAINPVLKPGTVGEMVMDVRPVEVVARN